MVEANTVKGSFTVASDEVACGDKAGG